MHFNIRVKIVPVLKVRDMRAAVRHYTEVLDFVLTWPQDTVDSPVVDLGHEQTELQIRNTEPERRTTNRTPNPEPRT